MGLYMANFSLPFATSLLVPTVNLQLFYVTHYSPVWKVLAVYMVAAMWTILPHTLFISKHCLQKVFFAAACLLSLPGNQIASKADVLIRCWVTDKLIVISSFKPVFYWRQGHFSLEKLALMFQLQS